MFSSTIIDYFCGKLITAPNATQRQRKGALIFSICINLLLLAFFKYTSFALNNVNYLQETFGLSPTIFPSSLYSIILPIGISFYTFQSMSYSIDLYKGDAKPATNFIDFACYVSMFPQLVAGPIVRYQTVANQLVHRYHSINNFLFGIVRFNLGFAKKILLANPMGQIADTCFASAENASLDCISAWLGITAYAFQIYFDFSAYSDMAIGLGRMFGFRYLENFDSPYKSKSITEFWRRWHISLSTFLRDYLYIPLGGNRKGNSRTYVNLMTVMLLGGLWHGASWNFVIWGGIHGLNLGFERMFGKKSLYEKMPSIFKIIITFVIVNISWVFFRAENLSVAFAYLKCMFGFAEVLPNANLVFAQITRPYTAIAYAICVCFAFIMPNTHEFIKKLSLWKVVVSFILFLLAIAMMFTQDFNPFLYFQF